MGVLFRAAAMSNTQHNHQHSLSMSETKTTAQWAILLFLWPLFSACDLFSPGSNDGSKDQFSRIFEGSLFDYFIHHNQALDAIEAFTQDSLLQKTPATLLHFDSHSDMDRVSVKTRENPGDYGHSYADYVNTIILDGTAEEIYWVLPDETRAPEHQGVFWNPDTSNEKASILFNGPVTQTFYVHDGDRIIYFARPEGYGANPASYRKVVFHKVILEELGQANFNRPVIIDIDGDYFSNKGSDTPNKMAVPYKEHTIIRFLSTLDNLGIRPVLTLGALSPDYIDEKDKFAIERFFQDIGERSRTGDYLIGYKHMDEIGDLIIGSNIRRRSRELYQGIYELSYIDLREDVPDRSTPIDGDGAEYRKALKRISMSLGVSGEKAAELLLAWDNEDGVRDSAVNYYQIEQSVQKNNGYKKVQIKNKADHSPKDNPAICGITECLYIETKKDAQLAMKR
jgi:hypothetical protein